MNLFEGKSPAERNKLIAAIVLGTLAILSLGYTFKGWFFPAKKNPSGPAVTVNVQPSVENASQNPSIPSQQEMDFEYTTTAVVYDPGNFNAPDPGRNIFAFYEPGRPTPYVPTPPQTPVFDTPTPSPPPPIYIAYTTPQSVYAGSKGFRLEVNGDKFTTDSVILFNGNQLRTTYVSPQTLYTSISDGQIAFPGSRGITVITPGGKYSNLVTLDVQDPPKPQFTYIGLIARKRYNNDTAYFEESGGKLPFGARLNDVIGGRFRVKSISPEAVVVEDVNLGFTHPLPLKRPTAGTSADSNPGFNSRGGSNPGSTFVNNPNPNSNTYQPYNPNVTIPQGDIPGIPGNIRRYVPPQPANNQDPRKDDVDDDDGIDKP